MSMTEKPKHLRLMRVQLVGPKRYPPLPMVDVVLEPYESDDPEFDGRLTVSFVGTPGSYFFEDFLEDEGYAREEGFSLMDSRYDPYGISAEDYGRIADWLKAGQA